MGEGGAKRPLWVWPGARGDGKKGAKSLTSRSSSVRSLIAYFFPRFTPGDEAMRRGGGNRTKRKAKPRRRSTRSALFFSHPSRGSTSSLVEQAEAPPPGAECSLLAAARRNVRNRLASRSQSPPPHSRFSQWRNGEEESGPNHIN